MRGREAPPRRPGSFRGIATDGEWVWPIELAYYLAAYHVDLPADFLDHIASKGWRPPDPLDPDILEQMTAQMFSKKRIIKRQD